MNSKTASSIRKKVIVLVLFVVAFSSGAQQNSPGVQPPASETRTAELEKHLDELTSKLDKASIEQLQEQADVTQAEVKQHDQTKVESALKYPVRISATLLFTSIGQSGRSDDLDVPTVALPRLPNQPSGSLSATARQTILGIDASGPHLWGARAFADINVDFFNGVSYADYSTSAGGVRLRTAHVRMEWPQRSLLVELDRPLVSPLQPTSWVTVGEPSLAWSGNLWTWSPQIEFKENSIIPHWPTSFEFALIDPPAPGVPAANGVRVPDASERSLQPGYEARVGQTIYLHDRPIKLGASGYYSRQAYSRNRHVDAWAGTADWDMPFARFLDVSGEFYRGRAIGGLGGGAFKDYVTYNMYTSLYGLDAIGGWGQLKFVFSQTIEANIAAGQDNAFADDLRGSDYATEPRFYANLARNQTVLGNVIYKPRSFLLLSAEFREIRSWPILGSVNRNRILGVAAGYSF